MAANAENRLLKQRLAGVPPHMVEALREATLDQDPDRLYDLIDGVADHDREVAAYLTALLDVVAYESLRDFFDVRGR